MTQEHPITPPSDLIQQWWDGTHGAFYEFEAVATQAARWGADQELEACCEWIYKLMDRGLEWSMDLRTARRPKPPSLKEQALAALDDAVMRGDCITISDALPTIRRALEALPE